MSRYFRECIFLLFAMAFQVAFSQGTVFSETRPFSFYFEKKNAYYAPLFARLDNCPTDAFIKYHAEIQIDVVQKNETYSIVLKSVTKKADGVCKYKNFSVEDFILADKITIEASVWANGVAIAEINMENTAVLNKTVIFDTTFISSLELTGFQFFISKIEYRMEEKGFAYFNQGIRKIDGFFSFDSLWNNWMQQIDILDFSNVDMLPIYQFKLKDIASEIKKYDSNEYEVLLSKSGLDNRNYLQKIAFLFRKIEDVNLALSQKITAMDELMFEKGKQFEEEQNVERAIFYYKRTLDYNPSHCDALERLSDLYTRQNLHKENLELFTNLRIRGEDVSCESTLTSSVCDSMCLKASHLIEQRNYYDAIKFLDTLALMFYQMSGNACMETYHALRKQAQDGIYNSYMEVINRGIKGNKIDLTKDYIYGLVAIMEKDKNLPSDNQSFMQIMERFLARYKENIKNVIKKKKYEEVIRNNDAMLVFLDSIHYAKNEEFLDSYSISCTEIYVEKKKRSEEEAIAFFTVYGKYIFLLEEEIAVNQEIVPELNDENKYEFLVDYVLSWNISADDFSILDTIIFLLQWEKEKKYTPSAIDHFFTEKRIIPRIMNALSKVNQYAWTNEFSSAMVLMKKLDNVLPLLDLSEETHNVSSKYKETTELLQQRIEERAEQEFNAISLKTKQLVRTNEYFQAYSLLKNGNSYLQKTAYQQQVNLLLQEVEAPAVFQERMLSVTQSIALGDFTAAFTEYEEVFTYFLKNNLSNYGMTCDSLFVFIKKSKQENLLKSACHYYSNLSNYLNAIDLMMYFVDLGYKSEDVQTRLGLAMKQAAYPFGEIAKKYTFLKVHKPFLESYLGKFGRFRYNVKNIF